MARQGPHTKLRRTVVRDQQVALEARHRRVLEQASAARAVHVAEHADGLAADVRRAPEVHLEHLARDLVRRALGLAQHGVAGVVPHDVDAAKHLEGTRKGGLDLRGVGHVEREDEEPRGRVARGEVGERGGRAQGCDGDVALAQDVLCDSAAEA